MFKNYLLVSLRNLQRNKVYSIINIAGLSIGIACSVLIFLWINDEVSYDRFHTNYDRLHQVYMNQEFSGVIKTGDFTPYPLAEAVRQKSSGVKHVSMANHGEGYLLAVGENKLSKMGTAVTEEFLQMFSFKVIKGNPANALSDPSSIVISQSLAKALFGDEDPMDKLIKLENSNDLKVTGVIEDVPSQSTLQFDFLLPFEFLAKQDWVQRSKQNWQNHSFKIFAELQPDASEADVNSAINSIIRDNDKNAPTAEVFLQPMRNWRLFNEFTNGKISGGMIDYVIMFSAIGIFILLIACINFMNLATARSESRAREVGIRKSIGSLRKQLIIQFLGESVLITVLAFVLALVFVELVLPFYSMLVNKNLLIQYSNPYLWIGAIIFILTTGIISGSYPAFYLSAFKPVKVLKGKPHTERGSVTPRKALVTLQFAFSIFLIIGTVVIYQQIMHVKARQIGYDRENLMLIWTNAEIEKNFSTLKEELKRTGAVKSVCKSSAPVTRIFSATDGVSWPGKVGEDKVTFTTVATEYDFAETMGVKMLEGRDFSPEFKSDSSAIVINKAALDIMGLQNPIGQKIRIWGDERPIVGVMDNIVMGSPFEPVAPLALALIPDWSSTISVRLESTSDVQAAVSKVEKVFKAVDPEHPLWYRFADTEFETKFSSINLVSRLALIFAVLAIFISCLGLFGLSAFTAQQRTKEMGIRKVLGASVSGLVAMIAKDFSKLVVLAFILAAPFAWFMLNGFLEQYPYRIGIAWWVLPLAGLSALFLAVIIVSTQALTAAKSNPVESLRSE
jgi:putative ABC transport system permease protein